MRCCQRETKSPENEIGLAAPRETLYDGPLSGCRTRSYAAKSAALPIP